MTRTCSCLVLLAVVAAVQLLGAAGQDCSKGGTCTAELTAGKALLDARIDALNKTTIEANEAQTNATQEANVHIQQVAAALDVTYYFLCAVLVFLMQVGPQHK